MLRSAGLLFLCASVVVCARSRKIMDPAFAGAGRSPGTEIWRIENFAPVRYKDHANFGSFHSGDSYIVLHTIERNGSLSWNLHFWLGAETSQDESGTAAIKTVELDDMLGGVPVQYREVQEEESKLFLSYFKKGIRYLPGGVKSGFKHVDTEAFEKRLYHVKGRRNIRVKEVDVSLASMNQGDCFILDVGKDIIVYCGPSSHKVERLKAAMVGNEIRDTDHAGDARVLIADEHNGPAVSRFFTELGGGSPLDVPAKETGGEDDAVPRQGHGNASLHRVTDEGGKLYTVKFAEKPLKQDMLLSGDAFVLDTADPSSGIYVWIGKGASKDERVKAMQLAEKFIRDNRYPNSTKVTRVVERAEPSLFKQYFSQWKEAADAVGIGGRAFTREVLNASVPEQDFNISSLHAEKRRLLQKNAGKAFGFMPDNGGGKVETFRVENFELVPNSEAAKGIFFAGDSYVIKYTYKKPAGGEGFVIYFWQGKHSSQDERAASAFLAVKLDEQVGGKAVQVRVVQGEEPEHFLTIFRGKMVVMSGGKASGFRNIRDYDSYDVDGTRLFRVRGTRSVDVRAEQFPEVAKSLASDDVFLLDTPSKAFLWIGKGASDDEKKMGEGIAPVVCPNRELVKVTEGAEPPAFWAALGGKGAYNTRTGEGAELPLLTPRLFHCIITPSGRLRVDEVAFFEQSDLNVDDCMVLDTGDEVYVWVGEGADEEEKGRAFSMAEEYIRSDPTDRKASQAVILKIKQGAEPPGFTALFPQWDKQFWKNQETLDSVRAELEKPHPKKG